MIEERTTCDICGSSKNAWHIRKDEFGYIDIGFGNHSEKKMDTCDECRKKITKEIKQIKHDAYRDTGEGDEQ